MRSALLSGLFMLGLVAPPASAEDAVVPDLRPFLRHAETASVIAGALEHVEGCLAPLDYVVEETGDRISLLLECLDGVSIVSGVRVTFQIHPVSGDTPLLEPLEMNIMHAALGE